MITFSGIASQQERMVLAGNDPVAVSLRFASESADTIRKNAIMLPAYTLLLGLIALLSGSAHWCRRR